MYTSASEVIREALRLMEEQDRLRQAKLEELRREVRAGLDSGASKPWDATGLKQKARVRQAAKVRAASMARVTRRRRPRMTSSNMSVHRGRQHRPGGSMG